MSGVASIACRPHDTSAFGKKTAQRVRTFVAEHAACDGCVVVQIADGECIDNTPARARLRIVRTEHHAGNPRMHDRAGAHDAGFVPPAVEHLRALRDLQNESGSTEDPATRRKLQAKMLALDMALESLRGGSTVMPLEYRRRIAERLSERLSESDRNAQADAHDQATQK
ncbi:MAG: hypothetical protein QOF74_6024 [Caballeronia mineralivorans]|nr:hypothetical protein [Caballeronia mineralivorans]